MIFLRMNASFLRSCFIVIGLMTGLLPVSGQNDSLVMVNGDLHFITTLRNKNFAKRDKTFIFAPPIRESKDERLVIARSEATKQRHS